MKKFVCLFVCSLMLLLLTACDDNSQVVTDPDTGETINTATEYVSGVNGFIQQPENAIEKLIEGMPLCYLDYIVDDADYLAYVNTAVTPTVIESPNDFAQFFESEVDGVKIKKGDALHDEMTLTDEGKAIYTSAAFYDSWHLVVLSVREASADTRHTITSASYSNDSCILHINGTREVAAGDNATVRHFVFRVPKNIYNGVSHSFEKIG